jgi:hypothetical protein
MFCRALDWIKAHWSIVAGTLTFACSAPFLFVSLGESAFVSKGMFLLVFMSLSWALMPWSIFVTSLFPLVLLPVLGLSPASKAASLYFNDAIALFLGSFIMTAAMERWQLHRRLALRLVRLYVWLLFSQFLDLRFQISRFGVGSSDVQHCTVVHVHQQHFDRSLDGQLGVADFEA